MIPPRTESPEDPFLLLLNGAQLVPLTLSWAVLLANFMDRLEPFSGREISEEDWAGMARGAVDETHRTYPRTDRALLQEDLELMLRSLVAIAQGREPDVAVGALTRGEYADKMSAPHRMDLMVSAMTRGGAWHCNQKCLHCYAAGQPMGESRELTTAEWKDVLARLRAANHPAGDVHRRRADAARRPRGAGGRGAVVRHAAQHERAAPHAAALPRARGGEP